MKVSEVKTNKTSVNLCSFLSHCKSDLKDLAEHSRNHEDLVVQIRSVAVNNALLHQEGVYHLQIPAEKGRFSFEDSVKNNKLYGTTVFKYSHAGNDERQRFTTLAGVVNAGIPTLVEARMADPKNISRYFRHIRRKQEILRELYGENHGWILMLPLDYVKASESIRGFETRGGQVAIIPYSASELQRAVQKYSKHDRKDSERFVRR